MKKLILSLLLMVPSLAFAGTTTVNVDGMTCGSCKRKVEKALKKLPGVEAVDANPETGKVVITLVKNAKAPSREAIANATKMAGFRLLPE